MRNQHSGLAHVSLLFVSDIVSCFRQALRGAFGRSHWVGYNEHKMSKLLLTLKAKVRLGAGRLAGWLDKTSHGRITPNAITWFGFAMHLPIAMLIAIQANVWAAVLLVIFGLFDTLDGELARLQKRASLRGMLLDASTDRMKEVLLYSGAAYALSQSGRPELATLAAAACGASLCVSYVKAKGEAAVASGEAKIPHATLNRMFADGLMTFEVRIATLVAGLLFDQLAWAVGLIAALAAYTAVQRLLRISKQLP